MKNYKNLKAGKFFKTDDYLVKRLTEAWEKLVKLNNETDKEVRDEICKDLFGAFGKSTVLSPFRCDYGENIYIGDKSFINFNVSMIDLGKIKIGNRVLIGPGTGLFTAIHPTDPEIRATGIEKGVDITIEDDVWIGGNATILPGVTIGKGSIIGAGSVVTKDIPKMTIGVGNPAKIIREIREEDKIYWQDEYDEYLREIED